MGPVLTACALWLLALAAGEAAARWARRHAWDEPDGLSAALGAVLTLTSLLLAFSFGFAASRYDLRRELVVREANAVGTAAHRADLLDAADAARLHAALGLYVAQRVAEYHSRSTAELAAADAQTRRLRDEMWATIAAASRGSRPPPIVVSVAQAFNEMFDAGSAQHDAYANHTPLPIIVLLFIAIPLCAAMLGFGLNRARERLAVAAFASIAALTVFAVLDFDNPNAGFIGNDLSALYAEAER